MNVQTPDPRIPAPLAVARFRSQLSWIWIVPAVAVLVALGLAIHAVLARGPEITLRFASAEGLEANKTKVRYKDVAIGTVTAIALGEDRHAVKVKVKVAMDKQAEPLLVEDSRFWVVRPRIGASGVSGLNTLLSGAYIAIDPGKAKEVREDFTGLDTAPLVVNDMPGRQFVLAADDLGSIDVGAPVYFRRVPVGRVVGYSMHSDGRSIDVRIFVDAPFDRFVTRSSRFWHAGGIDVSLDANGMKMEMQSLASLAMGGIAFSGTDGDGAPDEAPAEARFTLFPDRGAALRVPDSVVQKYVVVFNESVRGLAVGAPVDFRGLSAGEVSRIDLDLSPRAAQAAIAVEINLYPERLARLQRTKSALPSSPEVMRKIVNGLVASGLKAQLRVGNLLTGQSYVALDFFPNAKGSAVKWDKAVPELPTQPGSVESLQQQLQHLMTTLQKTVEHTDHVMAKVDGQVVPELTATLRNARKTLQEVGGTLASDSPTQIELRDALREVGRAAAAVRGLADLLERQPESLLMGRKASQ